ncbi:2-dehydro-3-deoxy-6-phosphogalactonate aldolase [Georgenia sp. TF02-10]|uniref:2-dehydro-3-deoxy-6-phosphogalactonate aldolase n=1 Tax=Georgenia sp. TF02-10 TaxID=2917725 RepID=UPI001FA70619|nr:2-dehydro-3-deoxy-6-phosphogalactonate aldolase [Georgenia sp. TF02-10]UNX54849.1 2-dehydro-3-deoxy-6-phosphogalactonate aldolase [Georgenia sp. TF02-10]
MTPPTPPASGLIAILRGLTPPDAVEIGRAVLEAGFDALEVPLNSPEPFESIARLRAALPAGTALGAGTVLRPEDVARAADAGSSIIVAPNTSPAVIAAAVARGLRAYPGVATATEAFTAVGAGATSLKIFPADLVGITGMRAWRSVLPPEVELLPVGGVDAANLADWARAGAGGAGIGSALYRPGDDAATVHARAVAMRAAWDDGRTHRSPSPSAADGP